MMERHIGSRAEHRVLSGSARTAATYARALVGWLACGGALATAGCGEAMADVVAIWVDSDSDDVGNRPVRIYEAGARDVMSIVPDIPRTNIDLLQVGLDARARGLAVSATEETIWIERGSGRQVRLSADAVGRYEQLAPEFSFTRSGDGLLRGLVIDASLPPAWIFAPLTGPQGLHAQVLGPPEAAAPGRHWAVHHAADAPVLILAEIFDGLPAVSGQVLALAYPSDEGEGPRVDDLRALARGTVFGPADQDEDSQFLSACRDQLCLSPSGRVLYTRTSESGCDLWRWSWTEAASSDVDTPPERVSLACPDGRQTGLAAVLDDDLVVLDDALRIYLVDLSAGSVVALPKPGGRLTPYVVDHGHGLVVSSFQGEVAIVDAGGPRMVSGVQSACTGQDGVAVSPRGIWVVQSCNGQTGAVEGIDGVIQRISVLGSDLYTGVPMRPIAIDDEGNALLYSVGSSDDDGVPRGLFVLTGDGQLTRIDELEPSPGLVLLTRPDEEGVPGRFAASGPS